MASLTQRQEYSRYYGDFRGVDFSSDHTQVLDQRLAYSVNMYKDYQSGKGGGIETIPGFRERFRSSSRGYEIFGIHSFKTLDGEKKVLVHAGETLYLWDNYPNTTNVYMEEVFEVPESNGVDADGKRKYTISLGNIWPDTSSSIGVKSYIGVWLQVDYDSDENSITIHSNEISEGEFVIFGFYEKASFLILYGQMEKNKSESFVFNNKLYIIDGSNYLVYDGLSVKSALEDAYIPTTYKNIIPSGENANIGLNYEERNILQPKFKHTFYADGQNKTFYLNEKELDSIDEVKVYDTVLTLDVDYKVDLPQGKVTMTNAPAKPTEEGYPENFAGIEITASKAYDTSVITKCPISAIFDDRVFLSGNHDNPNMIYFCGRSNVTGFTDPTYFPATNFVRDGVGDSGITGLIPVGDSLMAIKGDTQQDGSVYFHKEQATEKDLHPKDYPSARGLSGIGCLGACINFLDDPVFVSRRGLEGISKLQIASERSIEHRSSLVDAKLVNLGVEALKNAKLAEWNGYLLLLVDGKIFMADSRQIYTNQLGVAEYEWYYLEDIGVYDSGWDEYVYDDALADEIKIIEIIDTDGRKYKADVHPNPNTVANPNNETLDVVDSQKRRFYFKLEGDKAYICKPTGAKIGGNFVKATTLAVIDDNVFFGTPNGVICSFNFDKRNEFGEIPSEYYNFDGRRIFSGAAMKMDSCGIPHLTKNTIKKSTVIKTKAIPSSTVKVKVRTNNKPYEQIARISSSRFDFNDLDFDDFSFVVQEDTIFSIKEKEKKWVEKQYYIYSDEYCKPLSLFYITYRYVVAGRIK